MNTSEKTDQIYKALLDFQKEDIAIRKNATNPHFKNKYADLACILDSIMDKLSSHGLLLLTPIVDECVECRIVHVESGQWVVSRMQLTGGLDAQKRGSEITYFRRYTIQAALCLAAEDDDGTKAVSSGGVMIDGVRHKHNSVMARQERERKMVMALNSLPTRPSEKKCDACQTNQWRLKQNGEIICEECSLKKIYGE